MHWIKNLGLLLALVSCFTYASVSPQRAENARAEHLFERFFNEQVSLSPMYQASLGRKTHYGEWDDISPKGDELAQRLAADQLQRLARLNTEQLTPANRLNVQLLRAELEQQIEHYRWRDYGYPVNQMFGLHAGVVSFLINTHQVDTQADAEAYIERLRGIKPLFDQLINNLERRARTEIIAPDFVYPYVIDDSRNIISGAPFDDQPASPLWRDFTQKLEALNLSAETQDKLSNNARVALVEQVKPAYQQLIEALEGLQQHADKRAGVWKFPAGEAYYRARLQATTTTDLTAPQIHQIGLDEVERIHRDMRAIIQSLNFDGDLTDFFATLKEDPRFYYPDTEEGRDQYLADTRALIEQMEAHLPELFTRLPQAELSVKAVEPFREKSAGKAFYQSPAQDGSRPGIYYVNLHDLRAMPRYQMRALAYHEAVPGHHMQIAIAQELDELPEFRRHNHYTAYIEGWGLYAEWIPTQLGLYDDPYADFGRLSFELWRAIRLVVDTGIHHHRWSREQAIDYFVANSPMTRADATREVERYIVMPGQATAYKVGMMKIMQLREHAQHTLGEDFSVREFHDLVLSGGALPLDILEQRVQQWLDSQSAP
ncbi:DUF885 domain-containing protein [Gilvimarinus xylanilyticus]|uniref:DUF885 domain-containing protein n=1 Tax=Gilvimarinus xylanilyticus TaxID=2944139 RepID=A0A9X2KVI6_9GAMM|nr:DUF885 domain-containing protein [Gilvimarinus xylanilyticus]MCP8901003.1 DUF885 domain-containing protein [Gilvimarinus xylanilyticus]